MSNINAVTGVNIADYIERAETHAEPPETSAAPAAGVDFSAVFAEAARDGMMRMSATAGGGMTSAMPGGFMQMQDQGIEQAILAAAASGQTDDAQIALFMLMSMMENNQNSEFSMMMSMMGAMLMQIQADKDSLRSNAMSAGYDPFVLGLIDRYVFNWDAPGSSGSGQVVLPVGHWRPTTPAVTSGEENRNPELYRAVIDQFRVETAERYRPFRDGNTYCNIFMGDVTRAMGAEMPDSMGAIAIDNWLKTDGQASGWREVDAETAQMHANRGKPAVTSAGSLGHVQIICPSRDGKYDPVRGVTIAQAGRIVTNYSHISSIYSASALANNVKYWIHD